jgi:soluble lytic murein transglycosylase-like protein
VQIRLKSRIGFGTPCLLAALLCTTAHAFQRITLRNGFSYDCAHYEPIDSTHIRLFLDAAPEATNFIDLPSQSVASIETLPDPPQPAPAAVTVAAAAPIPSVSDLISKAGEQHHIDAALLASVIQAESGGHANAISRTGARGLMQLMPGTAQQLGVNDAFRPDQNIAGGTTYLDQLLDRYDSDNSTHGLTLALAAYNAGPAAVDHYHGIPPYHETRNYVARVLNEFIRRKAALNRSQEHIQEHAANPATSPTQNATPNIASLGTP